MKTIWTGALLLSSVLVGCTIKDRQHNAMQWNCGVASVCAHVQVDGDHVFFGVTNYSSDIVHVPWISGVNSLASGFSLKKKDGEANGLAISTTSPAGAPFEGKTLLVPQSTYGISITRYQAKNLYGLKDGCQEVVVEFRSARIGEHVAFAASLPTQICL